MLEMKGRGDIIRNAWKRHDYEWFVDNTTSAAMATETATATATATETAMMVNDDGAEGAL
jgi:hypothetical protein